MMSQVGLRRVFVLALAAIAAFVAVPAAASAAKPKKANVKVMTRNIYLGADLTPILAAGTAPEMFTAAGVVWRQMRDTNFNHRAKLLAGEVANLRPDVIGLQEVAHWQRDRDGAPDGPGSAANETVYDFLHQLRSELSARGLKYKVAVQLNEFTAELPVDNSGDGAPEFDAKLTMRDVTLVKRHLDTSGVRRSNYHPDNTLGFPTPLGLTLPATRGWTKVNVKKRGIGFKVVNTHLEAFSAPHRLAQARELAQRDELNGKRVILTGDLNSDPDGGSPEAYNVFVEGDPPYSEGGFKDRGVDVNTCCHDADLTDGGSTFSSRIDHVLTRGKVGKRADAVLTGADAGVFAEVGMWPSDHGGVMAKLVVRR